MGVSKWTTIKPKRFKEDCLLLAASWFNRSWDYTLFEIVRTDGYNENGQAAWYWGIFEDGDEWGDYADLKADKYCILPILKTKTTNREYT